MLKRFLAGLLTAAMLVTSPGFTDAAYAAEQDAQGSIDTGEYSVEGNNSVGDLLTAGLDEELERELENSGCNIAEVTVSGKEATVTFGTVEPAILTVGIYDEAGLQMLASGSREVSASDRQATVTIETDSMPEYFYIKAYLVDAESLRPLSPEFESNYYTRNMQEFLAKTTADFDADKVLNFDTDTTNNFAVYSDSTKIISQGTGVNTLVSAGEDTYVFANADDTLTALQAGDVFVYRTEEGSELVLKVGGITVDGTDVTITTVETSAEEVFSYVKIDAIATLAEEETETAAEEAISADGMITGEFPGIETGAGSRKVSSKIAIELKDKKLVGNDNANVSVTAEGSLEVVWHYQFYYDFELFGRDTAYVKLAADYELALEFSLSGNLKKDDIPLGPPTGYVFPVLEIITITIKPVLVLEASAQISGTIKVSGSIGFEAGNIDTGNMRAKNLSTTPTLEMEVKGEVKLYVGIALKPSVNVIAEWLASVGFDVSFGGEAKGSLGKIAEEHDCKGCVDGDISVKFALSFKTTLLGKEVKITPLEGKWKITDFYYSLTYNEFGWGECPHISIKQQVVITVKNTNGKVLSGADVKVSDGLTGAEAASGTTSEFGWVIVLVPDGVYKIEAAKAGYISIHMFKAVYDKLSVTMELPASSGATPCPTPRPTVTPTATPTVAPTATPTPTVTPTVAPTATPDAEETKRISFSLKSYYSAAISLDGSLYLWGSNVNGVLGNGENGSRSYSSIPIKILDNVEKVCLQGYYSAAITSDGSLYTWGLNDYGQLGNGNTTVALKPVKVLDNVADVSLAYNHAAAISTDGSLYLWGDNTYGQLGNNSTTNSSRPVKVLDNVEKVSLGYSHSAAITQDGSLYTWGDNAYGQLGNNSTTNSSIPVKVLDNVVSVSLGGYCSAAVTKDGSLYTWGYNNYGQLGNGSTTNSSTPVKVLDNVVSVSLEKKYSAAVTKDGSLYAWGYGGDGQLGNGSTTNSNTLVKILDNVAEVRLSDYYGAAITVDGSLYTWGYGGDGQLGNGSYKKCSTPVKVELENVVEVSLGMHHGAAMTEDGSLYTWGYNVHGELGNGSCISSNTPAKITIPASTGNDVASASEILSAALPVTESVTVTMPLYMAEPAVGMIQTLYSTGAADPLANPVVTENADNPAVRTAVFTGLTAGETYNFYSVLDKEAGSVLAADNLLYIGQVTADNAGKVSITYQQTADYPGITPFLVGYTRTSIAGAQVTAENIVYDKTEQYTTLQVVCDGTTLREGKDYYLTGDYAATDIGDYTVTVCGTGTYMGSVTADYKVYCEHHPVTDERVAPTETKPGKTEGSHCDICDTVLVAQEEIPMLTPTTKPTAAPGETPTAKPAVTPAPTPDGDVTPTASPAPTEAPTPDDEAKQQVEAFVTRMYTVVLERDPDAAGIADWTDWLLTHEIDGAGIAHGFIMSEEFLGKGLSDEAYVDVLYRTFFNREADAGGKETWMTLLAQGSSRGYVLSGFVNSNEFDTLCESFGILRGTMKEDGTPANAGIRKFVERCYGTVLGRSGDKDGLNTWVTQIITGQMSAEEVAKTFFDSEEFLNKNTTDAEYIDILYATFLDRVADDAGRATWTDGLAGGMTRTEVLQGFSQSEEFKAILAGFGL